jgi:hypothetical protein
MTFPLPFRPLAGLRGGKNASYVIVGMFTGHYRAGAERLAASCERFGLAYELHEVPMVHRSISVRGTDDLSFTKANFIAHMLAAHAKPVLYIDADCEILSPPTLIDELVQSGHDFAIYNWCAGAANEMYLPIELGGDGAPQTGKRYYRAGGVPQQSDEQLLCSGCVQFYRPTFAARALLKKWHQAIASMAGCADDMVLDFTFNNLSRWSLLGFFLRPAWLPKAYARIAWWIHDQPVINHPDFPSPISEFKPVTHATRKRVYDSLMRKRREKGRYPPGCIIDTQEKLICRLVDGQPVRVGEIKETLWL